MPRIDILAELKSALQTNDVLNAAIATFVLDMQDLKQFYIKTEHLTDATFHNYSKQVFSRWTIQEIFLLLAIFGESHNLKDFVNDNGLEPEHVLEGIFCYPQVA